MLFMTWGCKQSGSASSDTQGSGLSVGRPGFRDPRALQAQPTGNAALPSGPAAVKGQVPGGRQHMNSSSGTMSSPTSGSLSASDYAQSLNQYAKAMSSGRAQGGVVNQGQMSAKSQILTDADKAQILTKWNAMGRDAVQLQLNNLKKVTMEAVRATAPKNIESMADFSWWGINSLMQDLIAQGEFNPDMKNLVMIYNKSHPHQPPVVY